MNIKAKTVKSQKTESKTGKISWRPRWTEFLEDGSSKTVYGKSQSTKTEADIFSQDMVKEINERDFKNMVSIEDSLTLGEFAEDHWLKAERQIKVRNKAQIRTVMKFWKEIGLWDCVLNEITPAMMYKYIKILSEKGLKPATIQNYKTELRTLFSLAVTMGQINSDPLTGVKNERRTQEKMDEDDRIYNDIMKNTWTLDEIKVNLEKLRNMPRVEITVNPSGKQSSYVQQRSPVPKVPEILWYGRFLIGFHLGLRTGEIHALKFSDFDFENNEVQINKSMARVGVNNKAGEVISSVLQESRIKSSSHRIQMLTDEVAQFVKDLAIELDMRGIYHEDQYLFVNNYGLPLDLGYFRKAGIKIQKHCGIEHPLRCPKYTRHSSATVLASLGWTSIDIANHLGHKNDRVTKEYYIKADVEVKKRMAKEFNN